MWHLKEWEVVGGVEVLMTHALVLMSIVGTWEESEGGWGVNCIALSFLSYPFIPCEMVWGLFNSPNYMHLFSSRLLQDDKGPVRLP